ncbi:helix-turn-helix domain-containing protein [Soehngenia longivitae]|uniref:helix-turn-helix domain-containing protein n=1 Tax=Soehngenia longivitae TaxID=2562294 RepID=UPI001ADE0BB2
MNKTNLKDKASITYNVIARLSKGESVSLDSLYKICRCFQCNIVDIMEFKFD